MKRDPVVIIIAVMWTLIILGVIGAIVLSLLLTHALSGINLLGPVPYASCLTGNWGYTEELAHFRIMNEMKILRMHSRITGQGCAIYVDFSIPPNALDHFLTTTQISTPLQLSTNPVAFADAESIAGWSLEKDVEYQYGTANSQVIAVDMRDPELYHVYLFRYFSLDSPTSQ